MKLKLILSATFLLIALYSTSQVNYPRLINDSTVAFTKQQTDTIAVRLSQLDNCKEELSKLSDYADKLEAEQRATHNIISQLSIKSENQDKLITTQRANLSLNNNQINSLQKKCKKQKKILIFSTIFFGIVVILK